MGETRFKDINFVLDSSPDETEQKYLTFWTDGQLFAIPILNVEQIAGIQEITSVPDYPDYLKGIINMRGTVIPVLDFRLRMGKSETPYHDRTCIIVVNVSEAETSLGYLVDGVEEVLEIDAGQISMPPTVTETEGHKFVTGIIRQEQENSSEERLILCVDPAKVVGTKVVGSNFLPPENNAVYQSNHDI